MLKSIKRLLALGTLITLAACSTLQNKSETQLETIGFNPGAKSLFPISSVLVSGLTEVMLVDAQFQRDDAQTLINLINASGKELTTIYISHGDPDFYFGLDAITEAFPKAKVLISPTTQAYIKKSIQPKLDYWGPILKENAPQALVLPEVVETDTLLVDGQEIKIIGLDGHDPKHTYLWIPSTKTVLGGVLLYENMHAWIADTQTPESRQKWYKSLDQMQALNPEVVIPGHYLGESSQSIAAIEGTREYVKAFEEQATQAADAADLMTRMKARYPGLEGETELDISSKVIMGEMSWP